MTILLRQLTGAHSVCRRNAVSYILRGFSLVTKQQYTYITNHRRLRMYFPERRQGVILTNLFISCRDSLPQSCPRTEPFNTECSSHIPDVRENCCWMFSEWWYLLETPGDCLCGGRGVIVYVWSLVVLLAHGAYTNSRIIHGNIDL